MTDEEKNKLSELEESFYSNPPKSIKLKKSLKNSRIIKQEIFECIIKGYRYSVIVNRVKDLYGVSESSIHAWTDEVRKELKEEANKEKEINLTILLTRIDELYYSTNDDKVKTKLIELRAKYTGIDLQYSASNAMTLPSEEMNKTFIISEYEEIEKKEIENNDNITLDNNDEQD